MRRLIAESGVNKNYSMANISLDLKNMRFMEIDYKTIKRKRIIKAETHLGFFSQ